MHLKLLYAVEKIWSDKSHSFVGTKKMKAQQLEHTQNWKVEIKEVSEQPDVPEESKELIKEKYKCGICSIEICC
jgi:hypothetical protein